MKKTKYSFDVCIMHTIVIVLFLTMCVMACLFYHAMNSYEVCVCGKTAIDNYLEMINGMVGLWMSILAVILMICGIWQYLHIQKVDNKIKEAEEEMSSNLNKMNTMLSKIRCMSDISILLRSIGALNDPIMLLSDNERKREVKKHIEIIIEKLKIYVDIIKNEESLWNHEENIEHSTNLRIILLNLSLCVGRIQVMYTTPSDNLKIRDFIEENNKHRINNYYDINVNDYIELIRRMEKLVAVL